MRAFHCISFTALFSTAIFAQSGEVTSKFAIADVHARVPNSILAMRSGFFQGRYELRNATMVDLIRTAWNIDADKVLGGPGWLEMDRFDVIAMAPRDSPPETLRTMLQALLKERFHLAIHNGMSNLPAYVITAGNKLSLTEANGSEETGCKLQQGKKPPSPRGMNGEPVGYTCRNISISAFAKDLPNLRGAFGYLFTYRVVDQTRLNGTWNFDLKWNLRAPGLPNAVVDSKTTLFDAFEKQLGLKLELSRVATPVVVIDSVNQKPTANLPEVTEKLPAPPTEFEVASIKPENPNDGIRGSSVGIQHGGRVRIDMTLKGLIGEAWNALNPDYILGGPKSLDTNRFEVVAKINGPEFAAGPAVFNGADIDSMRIMLRALLKDRFRLVTHEENRLVPGYALVAAKPKLRKADPANRPGCKEGPGSDGKDPRITDPIASKLITCRNMTLAQFSAELRNVASEYLYQFPPVVDLTRVKGRYDFTLNFSPYYLFQKTNSPATGSTEVASDPSGAISLFEAMEKQLGLKLKSTKVIGTVLVIDHVEENPAEN